MSIWYASPTGTSGNSGTIGSPWSLAHVATGAGGAIVGGDTVLFLSGTYDIPPSVRMDWTASGTVNAPICWAPAVPGGAIINGAFQVLGNNIVFYGLRITWLHDGIRTTTTAGSAPADVPRAVRGVPLIFGQNVRFVECIIYDHAGGLFGVNTADNLQILDCLVYNNGWTGPDRGHGHGFYMQNNGTTRHRMRGNILWCNGSSGIKLGGTGSALLLRFDVWENCAFNNQLPGFAQHGLEVACFYDGGGVNKGDSTFIGNFFAQQHDPGKEAMDMGDGVAGAFGVTITDNVLFGRTVINEWPSMTFRRNVLTDVPFIPTPEAPRGLFRVKNVASFDIDENVYATLATASPLGRKLVLDATYRTWTQWRAETPYDDNSTFIDGPLTTPITRAVPCVYTRGKGHIYVLNPQGAATVTVDLGPILAGATGFPYAIYHVYDYVTGGAPTVQGTYDGTRITLPMTSKTPPTPFGGAPLPTQNNTFGAFVLVQRPGWTVTYRRGI